MRTIAVVNQKGGCGKTTVSINLASALAELGHRTLLVDMDPQGHCAVGLAVPEDQIEDSIYDIMLSKVRNEPIKLTEILWQISENLDLAPASIDLAAFEQQMSGVINREDILKSVIDEIKNDFDFIVIDCPPAVCTLTFNALRAATEVIVPVETGYFSLHGLSKQLETLDIVSTRCDQNLNVKVLASMYDVRTKMGREILAELKQHFGDKMFKTVVNFNTKLKEAASFGQPINEYDPTCTGKSNFTSLAEEVVGAIPKQQNREIVNALASKIEAISTSANELLEAAGVEKIGITDSAQIFNEKLSDYYGVHKMSDSVAFVTLYPRAESVQIAGDFNQWKPENTQMSKVGDSGVWQTQMALQPGKYRYRYVVDGQWQQDPWNEQVETNPFGEYNSILMVE